MKYLIVLTAFISTSLFAGEQFTYGGLNLGGSFIQSEIESEENNQSGLYYGVTLGHEFKFESDFNLNIGLEYNKHRIETELNLNEFSKVVLDSRYLSLQFNPTYSLNKRFDIGLKVNQIFGNDGILISQEENLKTLVGLNTYYNIHHKNNKMRVEFAVQGGAVDSSYVQAGLSFQYAFGWTKNKKVSKRKIKKSSITTITFEDSVVNFKTNSAELSLKSKAFLAEVGTFLNENSYAFKEVKIVGHTSLSGDADYNKYLSYERTNAVFNVLRDMKVPKRKVTLEGAGETRPLFYVEDTEMKRRANRRVEMQFIEMTNDKKLRRFISILKKKHNLK